MTAQKCPVCGGSGKVWVTPDWSPNATGQSGWYNTCHACGGSGIIYDKCCDCCCRRCKKFCPYPDPYPIITFSTNYTYGSDKDGWTTIKLDF